jgi:hypothetical protein
MGGNVFKNRDQQSTTQRINQTDVKPTLQWLEQLTDLDLTNNTLGTTGLKPTSGDMDVAVDVTKITPDQLVAELTQWCMSHKLDPKEYIKRGADQIHFKTPITGNPDKGYVQTDFMFMDDMDTGKFFLSAPTNSEYSGKAKHVMLNSIGKPIGVKIVARQGLVDRATNKVITKDPDEIAKKLLGNKANKDNLYSVEAMLQALESDPQREAKLADARAWFKTNGIPFNESKGESDINFLARLRDRIVNQGMTAIFEAEAPAVSGGKAKGIEHIEDLVFRKGTAGIKSALDTITHLKDNTKTAVTVKWDGKPAVIFGRDPEGQFVLTDTAGFTAVGYNGLFTSPKQITQHLANRDAEADAKGKSANRAKELAPMYQKLWPMLEQATPPDFKGYIQGDLLYTNTPQEVAGAMSFKPNTVQYNIPVSTKLGQEIADSEVGIAIHTRISKPGGGKEALGKVKLNPVPGLLLIEPIAPAENVQPTDSGLVKQLKGIVSTSGQNINTLFSPAELRSFGISDLPKLCVDYINSIVKDNTQQDFNPSTLVPGFGKWLQSKVTPSKYNHVVEYLQSPRSNMDGMTAAFSAFILLHKIKMDMLQQLDRQSPGQEGWVVSTPGGMTKFVNRFGFSRANFQH